MENEKRTVELRFTSLLNLWCFKTKTALDKAHISTTNNSLIAELSEKDVAIAVRQYGATLDLAATIHPL